MQSPKVKPRKRSKQQQIIENLVVHEQFMVGNPSTTKQEKDTFWMSQMKMATKLVKIYNLEFILWVIPPYGKRVPSLAYFIADYGKQYLQEQFFNFNKSKLDLSPKIEKVELSKDKIGEDAVINKPKTLKDFLNLFQTT
jgi:hypothetical protein